MRSHKLAKANNNNHVLQVVLRISRKILSIPEVVLTSSVLANMSSNQADRDSSSESSDVERAKEESTDVPLARPIGPQEVAHQLAALNASHRDQSTTRTNQVTNPDRSTTIDLLVVHPDGHAITATATTPALTQDQLPGATIAIPPQYNNPGPHTPILTPVPAGQEPSPQQMDIRVHAFRQRAGPLVGLTDIAIRRILTTNGWDLPAAMVQWNIEIAAARARQIAGAPGRTRAEWEYDRLIGAPSLHQNHRLGINQLYQNHTAPEQAGQPFAALRGANVLRRKGWVLSEASDVLAHADTNKLLRADLDREERRWRMRVPNQCHRDERLALLVEITGTDDWVSVQALLERCNYDLAVAVETWMQQGLPTRNPTHQQLSRLSYRAPQLRHEETDNIWPGGRPLAGPLVSIDRADLRDATYDYREGPYKHREGWLINYDDTPARSGVIVNEYKRYSTARNDYVAVNEYEDKPRKLGTGTVGRGTKANPEVPAEYEDFDWYNNDHVGQLNKWKGQPFRRTTGVIKKRASQAYHPLELQWLYDWHFDAVIQTIGNRTVDEYRTEGRPWPITLDLDLLTRQFNEEWTGRTDLPDTNGEARNDRTKASLDLRRKRIPDIAEDFGLRYQQSRNEKADILGKRPRKEDGESDKEERGGVEDEGEEDESHPSAATRRTLGKSEGRPPPRLEKDDSESQRMFVQQDDSDPDESNESEDELELNESKPCNNKRHQDDSDSDPYGK